MMKAMCKMGGAEGDPSEIEGSAVDRSAGVPPAVPSAISGQAAGMSRQTPLWATLVATLFGMGRLRPGPGSWASAATVLLWAALAQALSPAVQTPVVIALAALITLVAIPAATQVARGSGIKDPQ